MKLWQNKQKIYLKRVSNVASAGFTIIEILIVIVVIAILATLTFVVYKNITGKAQAAVTRNIVQQYTKALVGYQAQNGNYPNIDALNDIPNSAGVCLGTGYEGTGCGTRFGTGKESSEFNELMHPFIGNAPDIRPHTSSYHFDELNFDVKGILLQHLSSDGQTLNGQPMDRYAITYALDEPDVQCVGGEVMRVGSTPGTSYLTGDFKNTLMDGKNTGCFVLLPE